MSLVSNIYSNNAPHAYDITKSPKQNRSDLNRYTSVPAFVTSMVGNAIRALEDSLASHEPRHHVHKALDILRKLQKSARKRNANL